MAKTFDIKKFNRILNNYNQKIYALNVTGKVLILSNGLILTNVKDIRLCKRRVIDGDPIWKKNFDSLYDLDSNIRLNAEKIVKGKISRKGGINCQKKHGKKLKNNLNVGIPWNKNLKGQYPYSKNHTKETKLKIGLANSGKNNGMYGKKMSQKDKDIRSIKMKEMIITGKFTPNSNNRNTHWESYYKNKKYRSSWEALYQYFDEDAEYETCRISYNYENRNYIYIIDFINHNTKKLIEVKPRELLESKKNKAKIDEAIKWCEKNGYEFIIADKNYFIEKGLPTELKNFDAQTQGKIKKLYEISK